MFSIFTDPVKMAQQMEVITNNYGFAVWETLYALACLWVCCWSPARKRASGPCLRWL